jgi:hypothetical protein
MLTLMVDLPLASWLRDRAAALGVPYSTFVRDILAIYRTLVLDEERNRGISIDIDSPPDILIPDRLPGYVASLAPAGTSTGSASHLDGSPLSPLEGVIE